MSRPRKPGKLVSDLHDFCRFCGSNQRIRGTLQRIRPIFQVGRGGQTIANVLHSLGVKVSEDDKTRSHRMCDKCHRHLEKVLENRKLLEKWKQNELCEPSKPHTPTSAKKRCRESPVKTPRDSKKRLLLTPKSQKSTQSVSKDTVCGRENKAPAKLSETASRSVTREQKQETACRGENRTLANIPDRLSRTTVTITYPSKIHNHPCDKSLAGVVENIAKGKLDTSARLIMAHPALSAEIECQLKSKLHKEVSSLLAVASGPSVLRKTSPEDLQEFSYEAMEQDLKARAPILHSVLSTVGNNSTVHTCVSASVIIRGKEPRMSALAYIINSILQHGGVKRSALDRLCKMGITTSHKHAIKKQNEMSLHHDKPVKLWRRDVELYHPTVTTAEKPEESLAVPTPTTTTAEKPEESLAVPTPTTTTAEKPEDSLAMGSFQCVVTDEDLAMLDMGRLNITSSPPPPPPLNIPPHPPPSYSIIFDNLNFHVKTHHQTASQQNKAYNWTHHMAVQDRVNPHHLPDSGATKPLPDLDLDEVLPTHHTQAFYRKELIVICSRTITKHCKAFHPFKDVVIRHIPHQYSKVMTEKSVEVPLGLLFKDENVTGDLVDILLHLQKEYVPVREGKLCPIFAGGDRLSEGNSRNIQWAFQDGDTCEDRLDGLKLKFEDWHAIRNLHEIHQRIFYSEKSAKEHGTMSSNMNVLKSTNAKKGPHKDYNSYKEFVDKELDSLVLAVTMDHFGMETLDDSPRKGNFPDPEELAQASKEQRRQWLTDLVGAVVDKYVMMEEGDILGNLTRCVKDAFHPKECPSHPCRYPGCERVYLFSSGRDRHEVKVHGSTLQPTPVPEVPSEKPKINQETDFKRDHTLARLSFGLLLRNMRDSVKEGDGERLQRLYSYALLYYRAFGHTQYAYSCFLMKVQIASILSPYKSHSLTWNRFFNRSGGMGNNISLDLRLEHLNNFLKSFLKHMGPNLNEKSASRVSRSLYCLDRLMCNQDKVLGVKPPSGYHHSVDFDDDVKLLLEETRRANLLTVVPGRSFDAFPSFNRNLLSKLKYKAMADWMKGKLRLWNKLYHTDV